MLRAFSMTEPMPPAWTTPQTTTPTNAAIMTMACIKSEVLSAYKSTLSKVRAQLDAKLRVDLPARCAGQPAEVIEAAICEALDAAYAVISAP